MWKLPIIGRDRDELNHLRDLRSLPACYMDEWFRLGLLVDRMDETIEVLVANGYQVEAGNGDEAARVQLGGPEELGVIAGLLLERGIAVEQGDVIDGIYRG